MNLFRCSKGLFTMIAAGVFPMLLATGAIASVSGIVTTLDPTDPAMTGAGVMDRIAANDVASPPAGDKKAPSASKKGQGQSTSASAKKSKVLGANPASAGKGKGETKGQADQTNPFGRGSAKKAGSSSAQGGGSSPFANRIKGKPAVKKSAGTNALAQGDQSKPSDKKASGSSALAKGSKDKPIDKKTNPGDTSTPGKKAK